jgi:hypothetical protein
VMRRCPTLRSVFAAVLILGAWSTAVYAGSAAGMASYDLTIPSGLPAADPSSSGPQVVAEVIPMGSVVPPTLPGGSQGSPLTILPDSHGFDQSNLVVGLKNSTNPSEQLLGLAFDNSGFAPGGLLHFSLNINSSLTAPPELVSLTPGVTINPEVTTTATSTAAGASDPLAHNIPEPLSVIVWSLLAGAGLVRARAARRARV